MKKSRVRNSRTYRLVVRLGKVLNDRSVQRSGNLPPRRDRPVRVGQCPLAVGAGWNSLHLKDVRRLRDSE
jgi:hypothetical protein